MDTAQQQKSQLDTFVDNLIDQQQFSDLTAEVREEIKNDVYLRLDDFVAARMIAAFSDEDVALFEKLLQEGKPQEEIQRFTVDHIPDYQNFLAQVFLEFQDVYLGRIQSPPALNLHDQATEMKTAN